MQASLVLKKKRGTPLQRGLLVKSIKMGHQAQRPLARRMLKVSNVPLQADKENLKALIDQYAPCEGLVIPSDGGGKIGAPAQRVRARGRVRVRVRVRTHLYTYIYIHIYIYTQVPCTRS